MCQVYIVQVVTLTLQLSNPKGIKAFTKTDLSKEIKRYPRQQDVSKKFNETKKSIHNPIGQPLCVIISLFRINSFTARQQKERKVRRVTETPVTLNTTYTHNNDDITHRIQRSISDQHSTLTLHTVCVCPYTVTDTTRDGHVAFIYIKHSRFVSWVDKSN